MDEARLKSGPQGSALSHLASGGSAAGCLRQTIREFGLPGNVIADIDDLSHGPLHDAAARTSYLGECSSSYGNWAAPSEVERFRHDLEDRLTSGDVAEICIWAGDNVSEGLFMAMACAALMGFDGAVTRVGAQGLEPLPYVGPHSPEALSRLFATRVLLSADDRARLAGDYARLREERGALRRWEDGKILTVPADHYDAMIAACCPPQWTAAASVVGTALGKCDGHNLLSDLFVARRLRNLIDAGGIEAQGDRSNLRAYSVRRSTGSIQA